MGRPSKKHKITDWVGERLDPETLPVCNAHPGCFACVEGRCTALNKRATPDDCGFYKARAEAMAECRRCYERLKDQCRSDLISKYIKQLTAMGLLDEEIEAAERYGEELGHYEESNYQEQLEKAISPQVAADPSGDEEGDG